MSNLIINVLAVIGVFYLVVTVISVVVLYFACKNAPNMEDE